MTTAVDQMNIPDKEIERIFQFHDSLPYEQLTTLLDSTIQKIATWLSTVHVSVFTLEKGQDKESHTIDELEKSMRCMDPIIQLLPELTDVLEQQCSEQQQLEYTAKITKLQSEWSSLQHFVQSVKNLVTTRKETFKLQSTIEYLISQIDEISIMLFDFQEKKYQSFTIPTTSSLSYSSSTDNTTITSNQTDDFHKEDQMQCEIDHCYEPLLQQMEGLYQTIPTVQDTSILKRFQILKEKWESLQFERDELKSEQKQDRWFTVFKRVADQVDIMIDGLDRSVIQCYSIIQQVKKNAKGTVYLLKKSKPVQMDKEQFKSIEKSFEAKYKYYTPSIDRMLTMLGNGIATRPTKDYQTIQRHESMLQRWHHLKEVMDELRLKDLIDTERILLNHPTNASLNDQPMPWKTVRYLTPEPDRVRSVTPNSGYGVRRNSLGRHDTASDASSTTSSLKRTLKQSKHIDFYEEDENNFGLDMRNFTKPQQKTTGGSRSKSSLGHLYEKETSSIILNRRSVTPSLIPRPKTPSKQQRSQSRANSRMGTPSVPPLPKYAQQKNIRGGYIPDNKDPLDVEVARIINASPIPMQCQRASLGRYYFGNESSISVNGGKKLYACKLMTYTDRKRKGNGQNKVLIRVGGGWQDLDFFLLDHSSFMSSTTTTKKSGLRSLWKN